MLLLGKIKQKKRVIWIKPAVGTFCEDTRLGKEVRTAGEKRWKQKKKTILALIAFLLTDIVAICINKSQDFAPVFQ